MRGVCERGAKEECVRGAGVCESGVREGNPYTH